MNIAAIQADRAEDGHLAEGAPAHEDAGVGGQVRVVELGAFALETFRRFHPGPSASLVRHHVLSFPINCITSFMLFCTPRELLRLKEPGDRSLTDGMDAVKPVGVA